MAWNAAVEWVIARFGWRESSLHLVAPGHRDVDSKFVHIKAVRQQVAVCQVQCDRFSGPNPQLGLSKFEIFGCECDGFQVCGSGGASDIY